ncbi:MAG: hypothetical protein HY980_01475 [Candidatus Magasanikbacteria bacterium]|nr:hypothetical protein [Candidatus Magasanikbacteria bacterium]
MKINVMFVRYLLKTEDRKDPPKKVRKPFDKIVGDYEGNDAELRAFGAILVVNSELEETDVAGLTEGVITALKEHADEFSDNGWATNKAFASAIQKLGCAEQAFRAMVKAVGGNDPTETFGDLLRELKRLGIKVPTARKWQALNALINVAKPAPALKKQQPA